MFSINTDRLEMIEILLKGRKTLTHQSIHQYWEVGAHCITLATKILSGFLNHKVHRFLTIKTWFFDVHWVMKPVGGAKFLIEF